MSARLSLPNPPDRVAVRCFWLALAALCGTLSAALLLVLGGPIVVAAAVALVPLVPAIVRPEATRRVYRFWNRAVGWFGRRAAAWVHRVAYFVVLGAVGRLRSDVVLCSPATDESGWIGRSATEPRPRVPTRRRRAWIARYARWCLRSGEPWALFLLPYLLLLRTLEPSYEESMPENIYTLY